MIRRAWRALVRQRLAGRPAVALIGPRQSGKTTLARSFGGHYFDLEHEPDRLRLDLQWDDLLTSSRLVILDEAQAWPDVFPRLRAAIDRDRRRYGRFLLLGSVSPALMTQVSESLAGRLALVELTPFTLAELPRVPLNRLWLRGGFPDGGVLGGAGFSRWQLDYLTLLAQRDLPAWGFPAKPQVTIRLLRVLAAAHGQVWNASQIGQSLGLSYHTVNGYLDFLDSAFLIRRLRPFHANIGKRLAKSPKMYWRDSGLLHALHGIGSERLLTSQPWVGASWEGFVIEQLLAAMTQRDLHYEPYYLRTSDQHEIDLVLDLGGRLCALEIKLSSSPGIEDLRRLRRTADLIGVERCVLVSRTREAVTTSTGTSCSPSWLVQHLDEALGLR